MRSGRKWLNTALVVAASLLLVMAVSHYQTAVKINTANQSRTRARLIESVDGRDLFDAYCASCHGNDAKGGGPAAQALLIPAPDLTRISQRNAGKFPKDRVKAIISGDESKISAHGSREMPVWGPTFRQMEWDQGVGKLCIENLTTYLETIQQK